MALQKAIKLDNGIIVNYHRIVSINKITNKHNIIEVASYISKEEREKEEEYYESEVPNKVMNVFIDTMYIEKDYNAEETIQEAYTYLKTLDKFKDAEDV